MENNLSPHSVIHPPTAPPPPPVSNLHMLYYGLAVVGTAAALLVLYNLVIIKFCSEHITDQRLSSMHQLAKSSWKHCAEYSIPSFKYKKQKGKDRYCSDDDDDQCVVCLSMFEEGEELRRLPNCKHSFHASCIDMWLYSHVDCPICRAPVFERPTEMNRPGQSRPEILGPLAFV